MPTFTIDEDAPIRVEVTPRPACDWQTQII